MAPRIALDNLVDQVLLLPTKVLHARLSIPIETLGKPQLFPELSQFKSRVVSSIEGFLDLKGSYGGSNNIM